MTIAMPCEILFAPEIAVPLNGLKHEYGVHRKSVMLTDDHLAAANRES
jgi:hypothetical protein